MDYERNLGIDGDRSDDRVVLPKHLLLAEPGRKHRADGGCLLLSEGHMRCRNLLLPVPELPALLMLGVGIPYLDIS